MYFSILHYLQNLLDFVLMACHIFFEFIIFSVYKLNIGEKSIQKNYYLLMDILSQNLFIDPHQLLPKLSTILFSLHHQKQQLERFYINKIRLLQSKIEKKNKNEKELQARVAEMEKKYQVMEWKIVEKDDVIQNLIKKIKNVQQAFKDQLCKYVKQIDLTIPIEINAPDANKRINISQYFIKAVENSKGSTKIQTDTPTQSINSSRLKLPIHNGLLGRVYKSFVRRQSKQSGNSNKMDRVKSLGNTDWNIDNNICDISGESLITELLKQKKEKQINNLVYKGGIQTTSKKNNEYCLNKPPKLRRELSNDKQFGRILEYNKIQTKRILPLTSLELKWKKMSAFDSK